MTMTQEQLDALKALYVSGVKRVSYDNKSSEYDDEAGLRRRMTEAKNEISASSTGGKKSMCRLTSFSKD